MRYKLYIRYALSGVIVKYIDCSSKDDLYTYVGKLVLRTLEKIERIDFEEVYSDGKKTEVSARN